MIAIDELVRKATTTTTQAAKLIPQLLAKQIERNLRMQAVMQPSVVENTDLLVPGAGDIVYVPMLPDLAMADDLTEGTDMVPVALTTATSVPLTPTERGKLVEVTRKMIDRIKYDGITEVMDRLAYSMTLKIEGMLFALWSASVPSVGGSLTALYPNGHASGTLVVGDVLDDATLLKAIAQLEVSNNVPFPDGYYRLYITPLQYKQLLLDTNIRQDLRFAAPDRLLNGEKGALHGCRIIVSNFVPCTGNVLAGSIAALGPAQENSVNVAKALLVAPRWAAIAWKRRPEAYIDPTLYDGGRRRRFGITSDFDVQLVHNERAIVISTANV